MTVTALDRDLAVDIRDAIRDWPEPERRWWRNLLDVAPAEALLIGELAARYHAKPVEEDS